MQGLDCVELDSGFDVGKIYVVVGRLMLDVGVWHEGQSTAVIWDRI